MTFSTDPIRASDRTTPVDPRERAEAIRHLLDEADAREAAFLESIHARYGTGRTPAQGSTS